MAKKPDPYTTQAQAQSLLRFGPEVSALTALLRDAEQNRDDQIRQASSGRKLALSEIEQANPLVQGAYEGAQAAVQPAFVNGGGIESSALQARLGEAGALARTQLANRRVSAVEGASAQATQALRDFATSRGKIQQRAVDLGREQGAFLTSTISDMKGADATATAEANKLDATLTQQERNSLRSSGIDPDTGQPIPGGKLDPSAKPGKPNSGKGWATLEQQGAAKDEIDDLLGWGNRLKGGGVSRQDAMAGLTAGAEPEPLYREVQIKDAAGRVTGTKQERVLWKNGEPGNEDGSLTGTQKSTDTLPKAKSKLLLQAALDMSYDGHLSRRTQKLLHDRGIQLGPLGLTTFGEWLKTPEGQAWKRSQSAPKPRPKPTTPAQTIPGVGGAVQQGASGSVATVRQILANPGRYTAKQVATARTVKANNGPETTGIQANGDPDWY